LKSRQGHAARNARIATPDHAGLLASTRRRFLQLIRHCKSCSPRE